MYISASPKRATLHYTSNEETSLIFECSPADDSPRLEIGEKHIYASRNNRTLFSSKRHACDLTIRIRRKCSLTDEMACNLNLSTEKVGELTFCPPYKEPQEGAMTPASLDATVFLEDHLVSSLVNTLHSGKRLKGIQLDIEKEGILEYGLEPDGSRMEWKTNKPSDCASVNVTGISMAFELFDVGKI